MHEFRTAAATVSQVASRVDDADLDRPTPCDDWAVRDLLLHLLGLTAHFAGVARKQAPAHPPLDVLPTDWAAQLDDRLADLVDAWRDPDAWTGDGEAGGVHMPNADLGVVALEEIVLHGWDLAAAVGAPFAVDPVDLEIVRGFVVGFEHADAATRGGLYGPVVTTPTDDRLGAVLALAGRDPAPAVRSA